MERHPYMLPGLYDNHNGPRRGIVATQFPFGADYQADFAFVTVNSMMLQFTFIEIEDPTKEIFNIRYAAFPGKNDSIEVIVMLMSSKNSYF